MFSRQTDNTHNYVANLKSLVLLSSYLHFSVIFLPLFLLLILMFTDLVNEMLLGQEAIFTILLKFLLQFLFFGVLIPVKF